MYPLEALFVPAAENEPTKYVTLDNWRDIQTHVGGTFDCVPAILVVPGTDEDQPLDCWVNDEGLIWNLPFNTRASWLCQRQLVGNAIVTGPPTVDGDSTHVPDFVMEIMDMWYDRWLLTEEARS